LTLGDATFLGRAASTFLAATFLGAFFAGLALAVTFLLAVALTGGLDATRVFGRTFAIRADFFAADFGAVARFAFGFADREGRLRLLTEALPEARRVLPERLKPFVTGLLI
jgi:hypothetical protein